MNESEQRSTIREILSEFHAPKGGEGKFWVMHPGALPTERYLKRNGDFGMMGKAQAFTSLAKAEAASKKVGLNTKVVDHRGRIMEATKRAKV